MATDDDRKSIRLPVVFFANRTGYEVAPNGTRNYFSWADEEDGHRRVPIGRDEFLNRFGDEPLAYFRGTASSFSVLRSGAALSELTLTADQRSKLQALVNTVGDEIRMVRPIWTGGERPSDEELAELAAKSSELAAGVLRRSESELRDMLNADQYRRLGEILLQVKGVQALLEENVASALKLTQDQKAKLTEIDSDSRKAVESLPRPNNRRRSRGGMEQVQGRAEAKGGQNAWCPFR